ncbi:MAG: trypsin-like peptidase domain-containing protein [Rhodoglobus sp.]
MNETDQVEPEPNPTVETPGTQAGFLRRHRAGVIIGCATALALVIAGSGIAVGAGIGRQLAADAANRQQPFQPSFYQAQATSAVPATAAQQVGVVTVLTTLDYEADARAAGTGMVLTSSGEILTNNHVIQGATTIHVTVESTGVNYQADVVGSDTVDDIAVLQLVDSSGAKVTGLTPAKLDSSAVVAVGDGVTAIGNAGGTGDLVAAEGKVAATDKSVTVQSDATGQPESLTGLIRVSADVVPGDSGGPLLDARGEAIGMVTAASSGARNVTGFAITIGSALTVAHQIESGVASGNVRIGLPAFLGVNLDTKSTGTTILGPVDGSAAASAGLVAGDTITSVDGTAVTTGDQLSAAIAAHAVGDQVTIGYTDSSGAEQSVGVTLGEGPAA